MHVNKPAEYPEPDQNGESRKAHRMEHARNLTTLPPAPPPQQVVLFCPLPGQVGYLKWCITKYCADQADIFHMYAEMGNNEHPEMLLKFQDSRNPSVFVTTTNVGVTSLHLTAAIHAGITHLLWVLNEQRQGFARVVRLGENRMPHT